MLKGCKFVYGATVVCMCVFERIIIEGRHLKEMDGGRNVSLYGHVYESMNIF